MRRLFITIIAIAALTAASAQGIIRPKTSGAAVKKKPATTVRHKKPQALPHQVDGRKYIGRYYQIEYNAFG